MTVNAIMENYTYNLTGIVSADLINDPTRWAYSFNTELGGLWIIGLMAAFAIGLFFMAYKIGDIKHSKAAVYSGLVTSVIGLLLFFIEVDGNKLLTFPQLMIFLVATGIAILIDKIARNW